MNERKNSSPQHLSSLLNSFFQARLSHPDQKIKNYLKKGWVEICKKYQPAKSTQIVDYQNGHLLLWVKSAVEIQELSFYKEDLKKYINAYLKKQISIHNTKNSKLNSKKYQVTEVFFTINQKLLQNRERSLKLLNQFK